MFKRAARTHASHFGVNFLIYMQFPGQKWPTATHSAKSMPSHSENSGSATDFLRNENFVEFPTGITFIYHFNLYSIILTHRAFSGTLQHISFRQFNINSVVIVHDQN